MKFRQVQAVLQPYATSETYGESVRQLLVEEGLTEEQAEAFLQETSQRGLPTVVPAPGGSAPDKSTSGMFVHGGGVHYQGDLMGQVHRYANLAVEIARQEKFDVIHAHDWMTYPAGLAVSAATGKPLVVHVHSTEFDRSGENVNQQVYDIERAGMHGADRVVCVSYLTRNIAAQPLRRAPRAGSSVVYNAVELPSGRLDIEAHRQHEKIVLFLGRITMQKGPGVLPGGGQEGRREVQGRPLRDGRQRRHGPTHASIGRRPGHRQVRDVHRLPPRRRRGPGVLDGRPVRHAQRVRTVRHRAAGGPEPQRAGHHLQAVRRQRGAHATC